MPWICSCNDEFRCTLEISGIYKTCFKTHSAFLHHHYLDVLAEVDRTLNNCHILGLLQMIWVWYLEQLTIFCNSIPGKQTLSSGLVEAKYAHGTQIFMKENSQTHKIGLKLKTKRPWHFIARTQQFHTLWNNRELLPLAKLKPLTNVSYSLSHLSLICSESLYNKFLVPCSLLFYQLRSQYDPLKKY